MSSQLRLLTYLLAHLQVLTFVANRRNAMSNTTLAGRGPGRTIGDTFSRNAFRRSQSCHLQASDVDSISTARMQAHLRRRNRREPGSGTTPYHFLELEARPLVRAIKAQLRTLAALALVAGGWAGVLVANSSLNGGPPPRTEGRPDQAAVDLETTIAGSSIGIGPTRASRATGAGQGLTREARRP